MGEKIKINPVTRISGFMEIEVTVENNEIVDAKTKGFLFRGVEKILLNRNPFDVVYFTERICGICSTAHSMASTLALEDALNITPSQQGKMLRDIAHGCEFLQNHIRHFYQYVIPDYVKIPEANTTYSIQHYDYRLPDKLNEEIVANYFKSLELSRKAHEMLAVFGGKAPHTHGIFIGGITAQPTSDKIIKLKSLLQEIYEFVSNVMVNDVYTISEYYSDYFEIGGGYGNLLSYGCFSDYDNVNLSYVNPSVYIDNKFLDFNSDMITENIEYSWYVSDESTYEPFETIPEANMDKTKAYSWVKASRYKGFPCEVGPLARQWLNGEYRKGISVMNRIIARVLETKRIAEIIFTLLDNIVPNIDVQQKYDIPNKTQGAGLIDTTRGALGHWLKIDEKTISFYQIITPTVWNFSTRDEKDQLGVAEKALIGTKVQDAENPVEIGRIIRSFDPCISCGTHVYTPNEKLRDIRIV